MSKRDLKLKNKDLEINVIDILSELDPSKSNKFTPFLVKMLRNGLKERKLPRLKSKTQVQKDYILERTTRLVIGLLGVENLESLKDFHRHSEKNRITKNKRDINQYNNWVDLEKEVAFASIKENQKILEKEVIRVVETDEWVAIRPLTLESSLIYGAGTKWCTAMKTNPDYFYRYSSNGVLTYVINKKGGNKYGIMYDIYSKDFSIWNAPDKRIDSIESDIPSEIIKKIYNVSLGEKSNYEYFSIEEKNKADVHNQPSINRHIVEGQPPQDPWDEEDMMDYPNYPADFLLSTNDDNHLEVVRDDVE